MLPPSTSCTYLRLARPTGTVVLEDPYLRLPLQFATSLEARLLSFADAAGLQRLRHEAEAELSEPGRWGTTFILIQSWGRAPRR